MSAPLKLKIDCRNIEPFGLEQSGKELVKYKFRASMQKEDRKNQFPKNVGVKIKR